MDDLSLILFISIVAPLLMTLLICKGKTRTLLAFLITGITTCLFCGQISAIVIGMLPFSINYCTSNITPIIEELIKAIPIIFFGFLYKPDRKDLMEYALVEGVGFAILENAFILASTAGTVSIALAFIRGFGSGMMHGICTLLVGFGISFVHTFRKLFYTGVFALISVAIVYHSAYNSLVTSNHVIEGFILPTLTFVPLLIFLYKKDLI